MINTPLLVWLFSGVAIVALVSKQNHFSMPALTVSLLMAAGLLGVLSLLSRRTR